MEYMRLRLPNQLPFFVAMVVFSLAFPGNAQNGQKGAGEQANMSHPRFTEATWIEFSEHGLAHFEKIPD